MSSKADKVALAVDITASTDLVAGVAVVSQLLGVTERRVQQLAESRGSLRRARGQYDVRAAVMAYCEFLRDGFVDPDVKKTESDERTRLLTAKADIAELEHAERAGELISAEGVRSQDFQLGHLLKTKLLGIPDRTSALLAAETSARTCHDIQIVEINAALHSVLDGMVNIVVDDDDGDAVSQVGG